MAAEGEEMSYEYTKEMREISGFGGSYEAACRAMVVAGLEWLDERAEADPKFSTYENIFGIIKSENDDAKALREVMSKAANDDPTGAMMQATIGHVLWIKKNGWDKYCKDSLAPPPEVK